MIQIIINGVLLDEISQKLTFLIIPVRAVNNEEVTEHEHDENRSAENGDSLAKGESPSSGYLPPAYGV